MMLAFDPADIASLKMRYDLSTLAANDGTLVYKLPDTSGNGYDAVAAAAGTRWTNNLNELNHKGYLSFQQVTHFVATHPSLPQPNTVFMVARVKTLREGTYFLMSGGVPISQTAPGTIGVGSGVCTNYSANGRDWVIYEFQLNGTSSLLRTNGVTAWSGCNVGTTAQTSTMIGCRSDGGNQGLFDLAHLLIFNAALTREQSSNVNQWLNEQYHIYGYTNTPYAGPLWFASPTGKSSSDADGSIQNPWDIYTAFRATNSIQPGDTLYLRGGLHLGGQLTNYNSALSLRLVGTSNNPIVVRPYLNEKPIIVIGTNQSQNNEILAVYGDYTTLRDVEITNPSTNRWTWAKYAPAVSFYEGTGNKLVNCIIHDTFEGLWVGLGSHQTEIYGCLIYNNGGQNLTTTNVDGSARSPDTRGHGHGIYARSSAPTTLLAENILFNQFGLGIQCYTTSSSQPMIGFRLEGNISFGNGRLSASGDQETQILLGGGGLVDKALVYTNFAIGGQSGATTTTFGSGASVGDNSTGNGSIVFSGNHWIGDYNFVKCFTNVIFTNNFLQGDVTILWATLPKPDNGRTKITGGAFYDWNRNTYNLTWPGAFQISTNRYIYSTFAGWTNATGFDVDSSFSVTKPTGSEVYVRTNKYEMNRAHIVVINWSSNSTVNVDLTGYVSLGQSFEIRSAQNPLGAALVAGTYTGGNITLPLTNISVAIPTGFAKAPAETGPLFNAFVLQGKANPISPPTNLHVPP